MLLRRTMPFPPASSCQVRFIANPNPRQFSVLADISHKEVHLCLTIKQLVFNIKLFDLWIYLALKMHASFFSDLRKTQRARSLVFFHFNKGITSLYKPHCSCFHMDLPKFPLVTCLSQPLIHLILWAKMSLPYTEVIHSIHSAYSF